MSIELVRGELERLFSLDELLHLSTGLLGHRPGQLGGGGTKAAFARALTDWCEEHDALETLLDAAHAARPGLTGPLADLRSGGLALETEWKAGDVLAGFTLGKKVAEGPRSTLFTATKEGAPRYLKVLRRTATRDRGAVQRFLLHTRLAAKVEHEALPRELEAGVHAGLVYVATAPVEGQPLTARIAKTGALHVNEARPFVRAVLGAVTALHDAKLSHGGVKLENVILVRDGGGLRPVLVDFGFDRLGLRLAGASGLAKALAPEQLRGAAGDLASDFYAFGALLFEVLTGKAPFQGDSALDLLLAHLSAEVAAPSGTAPRGWVSKELDELVLSLLAKRPEGRERGRSMALQVLDPTASKAKQEAAHTISEEDLGARIDLVMASPDDADAVLALESAIDDGAEPKRVAEVLEFAADTVEAGGDDEDKAKASHTKRHLLTRAARVFERAKDHESAERLFLAVLELDPADEAASVALEDVRRALGKHEEVIEMLLERAEKADSRTAKAEAMYRIGQVYVRDLDDAEQGVVAFAQAVEQDPSNDTYVHDLERTAGGDMERWSEVLQLLSQATTETDMPAEVKGQIFALLGSWYTDKVARPDLGLPCFQAVLQFDPANRRALDGLTQVYRRAQQWQELGQVLLARADRAGTPAEARDLRSEAAELLEKQLGDPSRARDLFEQVVGEDPGHAKATEALARIYLKLEDHAGYAKILERKIEALRGEARVDAMCKLAQLHEEQLNDQAEATRRYEAVLEADASNLTALKGLDRIFEKMGRYRELLANLERQLELAATPRQKIQLLERVARVHDEEFLERPEAAATLQRIIDLDGDNEAALVGLARLYRLLDRWGDVANLYERHVALLTDEARRVDMLLSLGRVLMEQVGSPDRARKAYERVLEIDPNHRGALEALAHVRAAAGDAEAAVVAVESLAQKADKPEQRADLWVRAAKLLEERGDRDGAIERYKLALDASKGYPAAAAGLRSAYLARGDANSAVELIAREIEGAEGKLAKARLYGEMALLLLEKLDDAERAQSAASKSIDLDPTSVLGLLVTGDIAFAAERYLEACKSYEPLATRIDVVPSGHGLGMLLRYADALARSGGKLASPERAKAIADKLVTLAPADPKALARAAKLRLDAGAASEAVAAYSELLEKHGAELGTDERADVLLHLGKGLLAVDRAPDAIAPLLEAADLLPESEAPIAALVDVYTAQKNWEEVVRLKTRRLDVVSGSERWQLLIDIGDVVSGQLGDRSRAEKSYVAALEERPDDRKTLTKLMQLYSEEKDWAKLVDIVLQLAAAIEEPKQKAKYVHTAAIVCARQLEDLDRASQYYDRVMELDPTHPKAFGEALAVREKRGDHGGVEALLKQDLERASDEGDTARMIATFDRLADLYLVKLGSTSDGVDALEAAQTLDPDNDERNERLAVLYANSPADYLDKAVASQTQLIRKNPYRGDGYRTLRKLYTEAKRADAAWCLCQCLSLIEAAEPDEERFFRRMRADGALAAADRMTDDDWLQHLMHPDADPLITAVYTMIEPAIRRRNGQPLEQLGYQAAYAIDLSRHPYPMSQTLFYAAGVLGMDAPPTFQNPNDPGGLAFLHATTPGIVLGQAALAAEVPQQAAAFIAARHLAYYRPALYLRHLVPTGTGLRAWLFAAIRMASPSFPVSAEVEGTVKENQAAIEAAVVGPARDQLTSVVSKLLQSGAIDLKRWTAAVDLTADRAGFLLANDLELASDLIKGSDESSSVVPVKDRLRELLLFAASEAYFQLRVKLGANIDG
jgi:tetratricopeptide (TPR) repeat protein